MNEMQVIDLVLPCYNPNQGWAEGIIRNLQQIEEQCSRCYFRLFIVSDGSKFGFDPETIKLLKTRINNLHIISYSGNKGKGYALRQAIKHCNSPYIIYTDYDFPYTLDSFIRVVNELTENESDVVVALRNKSYRENLPLFRRVLSESSHLCNRLFLRLDIHDTQGGLKGFNLKGKYCFLDTRINGFLFDTEFIYKAKKRNLKVNTIEGNVRQDIIISNFGLATVKQEMKNFLSILLCN